MWRADDPVGDVSGQGMTAGPEGTHPEGNVDRSVQGETRRVEHPYLSTIHCGGVTFQQSAEPPDVVGKGASDIGRCPTANCAVNPVPKQGRKRPPDTGAMVVIEEATVTTDLCVGMSTAVANPMVSVRSAASARRTNGSSQRGDESNIRTLR